MDDKRLKEIIGIIKKNWDKNIIAEMLQNIELYSNESGINKSDVSNLINKIVEELL